MVDRVRKTLLILILGIAALSSYHLLFKNKEPVENVELNKMEETVDIEIENFEVVHEVDQGKKWELKADLAQVKLEEDLTLLTNVEIKIKDGDKQELWVVADSGRIKNGNKDIQLDGNVKMVGATKAIEKMAGKEPSEPEK